MFFLYILRRPPTSTLFPYTTLFPISIGAGLFQELLVPALNERGEELDRVKIRGQLPRHLQLQTRIWLRSSDRKSTRLNSSHVEISYAVFCLKKKIYFSI